VPVLLSRLRIRGKLIALIILPLLVIVGLSAGIAVSQADRAGAAGNTARSVDIANAVGVTVAALQTEQLEAVGYLINQASLGDIDASAAEVDEQASDLEAQYGSALPPAVDNALITLNSLASLRAKVAAKTTTPDAVIAGYHAVIEPLIDATGLLDGIDTSTSVGREVVALDALLHIDELTNESAAILLEIAGENADPSVGPSEDSLAAYSADENSIALLLPRFTANATPSEVVLQTVVSQALFDRVTSNFANVTTLIPMATAKTLAPALVYPQMQSFVVLGRFAEQKTAADVLASVDAQRDRALLEAYLAGALGLIVVAAVAVAGAAIARSVAVPLTRLTSSTNRIAGLAERELLRVADDEAETTEPIPFDPVHITTDDEIGELARAFERISRTSVQLVGRQVASRRNVAQMFGHVGRRTQNLVGRQISLIDALEAQETDAHRLGDLYRLDHLTSRLRRNASSLVALSGRPDQGSHFAPLALVDVIRLGLAEIEEYTRVDVIAPPDLMISPGAINDTVLLLAELMENATAFSPPQARVTVTAHAYPGLVSITDHGIGLTPERMSEENARLAQRERLDLAPTEVLGLFVVGRLARRHGLGVVITPTSGGGVTVAVDITNIVVSVDPTTLAATALAAMPALPAPALVEVPDFGYRKDVVEAFPIEGDQHGLFDDAYGLFDLESLDRATQAIESGRPWNAFDLPQPALTAGPSHRALDTLPDASPAMPDQWPPAAEPKVTLEWAAADTGGLPAIDAGSSTAAPLPRRGRREARPPEVTAGTGFADIGAEDETQTIVMPAVANGLTRRVPGATIRVDQPSAARQNVRPQDPDEVWDMVQQFESGVARALNEVRVEPTEEDATR
jgi:signal transduction histidine kinase